MAGEYPKKYWWVILIIVPIVIAVIQIYPDIVANGDNGSSGNGGNGSEEVKPAQIVIFQATPSKIQSGDATVLQWNTQNATKVTLNGRSVTLDGNKRVTPQKTTSYTLVALNENGASDSATIEVEVPPPLPPEIVMFEARPRTIETGESSTLSWMTKRASKVLINNQSVALSGNRLVNPKTTTKYHLVAASDEGNDVVGSVEVEVKSPQPKILEFGVNPPRIDRGKSSTLNWKTEGADEVRLNGAIVAQSGQRTVHPRTTTTYELSVKGRNGEMIPTTVELEVVIPPAPTIVFLEAEPPRVLPGQPSILRWGTTNASKATLNGKSVALLDEMKVIPRETTRYVLQAVNEQGQIAQSDTTIEVIKKPIITYFNAEKTTIYEGKQTTLSWATRDAARVTLDGQPVPVKGNKVIRPRATRSYTLIAEKGNLSVRATRQVSVQKPAARTTDEIFISSVKSKRFFDDDKVKKAVKIIIEGGNRDEAKMLMDAAGYPDGLELTLDLSRFEQAGGTNTQAQVIAAKLWKIGIRVKLIR